MLRSHRFCQIVLGCGLLMSLAFGEEGDLRLRVARKLAEKGQLPQALQEVRMHLAEHPESAVAYKLSGDLLMRQGNKAEAADNYRRALALNGEDKEAQLGLAAALGKPLPTKADPVKTVPVSAKSPAHAVEKPEPLNPPVKVESHPTPVVKSSHEEGKDSAKVVPDPKYQDKDFKAAIALYREGKKVEAQNKLRSVLGRFPGHPGAYYLGGVMRYEAGEMDKAAFNFKKSFAYPERGFNAHFYLGRIYQKTGKKSEAIREIEAYGKSTPSPEGKERAAQMLSELQGNTQATKPSEPKSLEPKPSEPTHTAVSDSVQDTVVAEHDTLTHPIASVETPVSRLQMEDEYLFLIPDSLSAAGRKMAQAHAYYRRDRLELALQTLKEVLRDYPGTENADVARLDLAAIYLRMQLWPEARNHLEAFATGSPERSRKYFNLAHYMLGRAFLGEGKTENIDKAERYFLKVQPDLVFSPSSAERDWQLALCGEKMPDLGKRASYYGKALATNTKGHHKIYLELHSGLQQNQLGKLDLAQSHLSAALKSCQEKPSLVSTKVLCIEVAIRLADLAFQQKNWKLALEQYSSFIQGNPGAPDLAWATYQMGNVHKAQGHFDKALNVYQGVIDNFPDSYWAAQAKWQRDDAIWHKEYAEVLD
jgi:tetratricopeptide (TPR) repeat protein